MNSGQYPTGIDCNYCGAMVRDWQALRNHNKWHNANDLHSSDCYSQSVKVVTGKLLDDHCDCGLLKEFNNES